MNRPMTDYDKHQTPAIADGSDTEVTVTYKVPVKHSSNGISKNHPSVTFKKSIEGTLRSRGALKISASGFNFKCEQVVRAGDFNWSIIGKTGRIEAYQSFPVERMIVRITI